MNFNNQQCFILSQHICAKNRTVFYLVINVIIFITQFLVQPNNMSIKATFLLIKNIAKIFKLYKLVHTN